MAEKDVRQQEQCRMDTVVEKIHAAEDVRRQEIDRAKQEQRIVDADFKKNVRVKVSTYSGMMDTAMAVRQQNQLLQERENARVHAQHELTILEKLAEHPYFARIDFQEEGEPKPETIYIGLASFAETPDHFLIYDWRAPVANLYYDGGLGEVTYQTPVGEQRATVTLKRQFNVEHGKITAVFDTDEAVGDQMLLTALQGHSGIKMKGIVTTIQHEQNRIIRNTTADLLFVQGAAGSGKTSAVLQRVAYLLYRYRGKITSKQIVLFSPNQLFNDYVDRVLPEMGEHNMKQLTYYQALQRRVPHLQVETLQERFTAQDDSVTRRVNRLKESLQFMRALHEYATLLERGGMQFTGLCLAGKEIFSREIIAQIYYGFNENYHLRNRLIATKEELLRRLQRKIKRTAKTDAVQKAVQGLNQDALNALYGDHPRDFADGDAEFKFLTEAYVTQQFAAVADDIRNNRFIDATAQYVNFLGNVLRLVDLQEWHLSPTEWMQAGSRTIAAFQRQHIALADATPYLDLYDLITGRHGMRKMRHVLIDEIQDYTPYQLAYLKELYPRAKFTMLGDLNQSILTHENSRTLLEQLRPLFDPKKTQVVQLTRSYRSTKQLTDFTRELLVDGEKIEAFDREGPVPEMVVGQDRGTLVNQVAATLRQNHERQETTAVITRTLKEAQWLAAQLKQAGVATTVIKTENQRLVAGPIIVPAYLAKGLEFDAVIMWDASAANYHDEADRQLVYTICSRAMHRLMITVTGTPSPLFNRVDPSLYKVCSD